MPLPKRNYETLDAILVISVVNIIAGAAWALVFVEIPVANLPILSSLVGTLVGTVVGGYAGFRWASSMKPPTAPESARRAADQVAGAADAEADRIGQQGEKP